MLFEGIIVMIAERRLIKRDMKFKKIISVIASVVMLSSTIGFAAAASFPEPFVSSGTADGAVVYGAAAAISDISASIDVQANLQALVTASSSGTTISGTAWQVATSSDGLEIGEPIYDVVTYIDDSDLPLLMDGTIMNEKGTSKYEQFFYFEDDDSSMVNYTEDDDDNVGLFLHFDSGLVIARYVLDFTTPLKSDVTSANVYEDIEDEEINILGKTYTITKAVNSSTSLSDLTLMSGANKATVSNDEEITVGGKTISVVVSASTAAQFTIDGETTNKLAEGDTYQLSDGSYLGISDITYQNFQGGLMQATVYVGADKLFLDDESYLQVNAETINEAAVEISESFSGTVVSITEISINMTAEDDLYVPVDGKLSEATDLDEPEVLITQNWDIEFKGLDVVETEEFKFTPTGSDRDYKLTFNNYNGDTIVLPLIFTNNTGIFGGEKEGRELILNPNGSIGGDNQTATRNITRHDYFILNTALPTSATNDARSFVVQYKGADKYESDQSCKVTFDILGVEDGREMTLSDTGTFSLKLGGSTFTFKNASASAETSDNFDILLDGPDYATNTTSEVTAYMRTQYNALVNITDTNYSFNENVGVSDADSANWYVSLTIDDGKRDDDYVDVTSSPEYTLEVKFGNVTDDDASAAVTIIGPEVTDPDNSDLAKMQTQYGVYIESEDPSGAPATIIATIPESVVTPLVYITSGDVTVTPGTVGAGGQILVVKDSDVSSVSSKNLVVVGGSCINTVAAKILGSDTPMCEAEFTTATGAGAGQYIIKTVESPYDATKVAMLVAGYNAADTTNAVAKATEGVASDVGTEQVYPITTA